MSTLTEAFTTSFALMGGLDAKLLGIVGLSLRVSLTAVLFGSLIGLPLGAAVAVGRFAGRAPVTVLLNAFIGLPAVVVGLLVYLLLSCAGPLGQFGLLFTPTAMVIAQTVLITPLIAAFTRQIVADAWREYREQLQSLGAGTVQPGRAAPAVQCNQGRHEPGRSASVTDGVLAALQCRADAPP